MTEKNLFTKMKKLVVVGAIVGLAAMAGCSAHAGADIGGGSPDYVVVGD